jgi:predicted phosphodiesterase
MKTPSKSWLLNMLKKHGFVKQAVADAVEVDEKSIRRWCHHYKIDTEFEKKKTILEYEPTIIVSKTVVKKVNLDVKPVKLERVFVFSDLQIPYHSPQALGIAIQRCADYKPTHVVTIGDFMDYSALLGKTKYRQINLSTEELQSLDLEFIAADKILKDIERVLPAGCVKYFIKGNHEDRADAIIHKPGGEYWKKHLDIDVKLNLTGRGWKIINYNDSVRLGHLWYTHGAYFCQNHAWKHAVNFQKNVLFGHTHQIQVFTLPSPVRELPIYAASVGCLAQVNPEYSRNKPNACDHAWAEVNYLGDDFFPNIHRIIRSKVIVDGKLYKA